MRLVITLLASCLLTACAGSALQSSAQPPSIPDDGSAAPHDWYQLGKTDGEQGYLEKSLQRLSKLTQSGIVSQIDYQQGYQLGLNSYCQLDKAYILGVTGKPYLGVCESLPNGWRFYENWISGRESTAADFR